MHRSPGVRTNGIDRLGVGNGSTTTEMKSSAPTTASSVGESDDRGSHDGGKSATDDVTPTQRVSTRAPHRLRDLDRRGKLWAAAFAVALLLAPVQAFVHVVSDWVPSNDPALMGIQSLEVGSSHTPLTGQPSTSAHYVDSDRHVHHLGPLHFYLMAVPMRLLGPAVGMLAVSVLIVGTSALLMAWAFFRRLGPVGGIVGATLIGLVTFTTGAASLMNPVSSNMAGYPLFCAAVLLWCVMRGDLRLLPVATAVTAFAAQQHLSVLPTVAVLVPAAVVGLIWHWGRGTPTDELRQGSAAPDRRGGGWEDLRRVWQRVRRRGDERPDIPLRRQYPFVAQLLGWGTAALVVGLVLWSPMLAQEVREDQGNLTNLVELTGDDDRPTVGMGPAVNQVTHVLGLPPLLGRTDLSGNSGADLLQSPSWVTSASAAAVAALLVALGVLWHRRAPEKQSLVVWAGVLVAAGLVNGSSVVDSIEQLRIVFYHWIWPLALFVALALALGAIDGLRAVLPRLNLNALRKASPAARPALASLALVAVAAPAIVNPTLDRPSNELASFRTTIERRYIEETVRQIMEHEELLDESPVLLSTGARNFTDARDPVSLYLIDEGVDARLPHHMRYFVPGRRLPGRDTTGGLLIVNDHDPDWIEVEVGTLVADVMTLDDLDTEDFDTVLAVLDTADTFRFGPEIEEVMEPVPAEWVQAAQEGTLSEVDTSEASATVEVFNAYVLLQGLDKLHTAPGEALSDPDLLDFLIDHPLSDPVLDPDLLRSLRDSELGTQPKDRPIRIRVYALERDDLTELGYGSD